MEQPESGVGVLDKAMTLLRHVESGPIGLADLVARTSYSRATTHRLAAALEAHGLLRRDDEGRYVLGAGLVALGRAAERGWPLGDLARPALAALRDATGESAQLFVRDADRRVCVASLESSHGLRTIVATGAALPLDRGSGGRVLSGEVGPDGWLVSMAEREPGVASVSAPVCDTNGSVVAAVGVSGPIDRLGEDPGAAHGAAVVVAAAAIESAAGFSRRSGQ